jgi:hypothetical protein
MLLRKLLTSLAMVCGALLSAPQAALAGPVYVTGGTYVGSEFFGYSLVEGSLYRPDNPYLQVEKPHVSGWWSIPVLMAEAGRTYNYLAAPMKDHLRFSFTDGVQTLTDQNVDVTASQFSLRTDAQGRVIGWNIQLHKQHTSTAGMGAILSLGTPNGFDVGDTGRYFGCFFIYCGAIEALFFHDYFPHANNNKRWTTTTAEFDGGGGEVTSSVPEPASQALLLAGMGALAWATRHRREK